MNANNQDRFAGQWQPEADDRQLHTIASNFRFVAACNMPIKPIAWLVHNYIEEDALTVMYGPPGKGKSFVALDLSCCIASGTAFHGHSVKPGIAIYIAGEGHNGIARRLHAWALHNQTAIPPLLYVSEAPTDLSSATNAARVAEAVRQIADATNEPPVLIVIDTMARNFSGDENSATDVGQFIRNVDALRRHWKATVLVVHHSGKDGLRGARGSSALKGAADAEYEVSRSDEDKLVRLTPRKMKDAEEPPSLAFELIGVQVRDNSGAMVGGAALRLTEYTTPAAPSCTKLGKQQKAALETLERMHSEIVQRLQSQGREDHPVYITTETWKEKCEETGIPRQRFHDAKNSLVERELIRIDGAHVFLVRPIRSPLESPDRTDNKTTCETGQTGHEPDENRTLSGQHPKPALPDFEEF
jgi:hypothetical protein